MRRIGPSLRVSTKRERERERGRENQVLERLEGVSKVRKRVRRMFSLKAIDWDHKYKWSSFRSLFFSSRIVLVLILLLSLSLLSLSFFTRNTS